MSADLYEKLAALRIEKAQLELELAELARAANRVAVELYESGTSQPAEVILLAEIAQGVLKGGK